MNYLSEKTVGRNKKLSEIEVINIIEKFRNEVQPQGVISYSDIFNFAQSLYEKGEVAESTSLSYWRKTGRLGRELVDRANEAFSEKFSVPIGDEKVNNNVFVIFEKYQHDSKKLLRHLSVNERKHLNEIERLTKEKEQINLIYESEKTKRKSLEENCKNLQAIVFKTYKILMDKKTNNPSFQTLLNSIMQNSFTEEELINVVGVQEPIKSNVISIGSKQKKKLTEMLLDE